VFPRDPFGEIGQALRRIGFPVGERGGRRLLKCVLLRAK
jgi:hypothetical protein